MAQSSPILSQLSATVAAGTILVSLISYIAARLLYNIYFHPLAQFPGPWYATATSLTDAIISLRKAEPAWLLGLTKKYGTDRPIRIAPRTLLFASSSSLKDIYWDARMNFKSELYGTGALGPPSLFDTRDGKIHQQLRKALGGNQWSIGSLKNFWEPKFDQHISLFLQKMTDIANAKQETILSDRVAEFAADIMTMVSFSEPWGFVRHGRDERGILHSWRLGLPFFGLVGRWRWFRQNIIANPNLAHYLLPAMSDKQGMGYLYAQANREVDHREMRMKAEGESFYMERPDFLQHCLDARHPLTGLPLTAVQKRAHVTLLIQAGADTTATALGSTLRFLLLNPRILRKAQEEIGMADREGKLSNPIAYEESRRLLPYMGACIKEALRLNPPAPNQFGRVTPEGGKTIDGHRIPPLVDVTTVSYIVQRDPKLYAPDPESYRPERWIDAEAVKLAEMESSQFVFGMGPRVCLGKDIAIMELWKLLPEIIRNFEFELLDIGRYIVAGGVAYNYGLK
ncbi:uncharacterized protein JN550_012005, partial [Neoarthrinium moseri]|uniref:uncharacterized protein n=1 Tax=Neoarthrinium moseri TaxID=1658444 RepID=UPI001FDBD92F